MVKLKPVELFELEVLKTADTFTAYDCVTKETNPLGSFEEAVKVALTPNTRLLVYGFNSHQETNCGAARKVLITKRLLEIRQ